MNNAMWSAIREYVAAESKLAVARALKSTHLALPGDPIPALEEQSTRMETEVRRLAEAEEERLQRIADIANNAAATANAANSHFVRY